MKRILETDSDFICNIDTPCFQLLNNEEISLVQSSRTQVIFRKGDIITKQGTFPSYVLFIVKGFARQYLEGTSNKNYNLKINIPGEFIGLASIYTKQLFNYSTVAMTDCQAYLIEKDAIIELIKQNGNFGYNLTKRYLNENAPLFENLSTLLYKQMNGRLAEKLLYLNSIKSIFPDLYHNLSRKDLADFCGISTENTVKLLKSYQKEGIIDLQEKEILILNEEILNEISLKG